MNDQNGSVTVGVIGLGSIATYMHLPALAEDPRARVVVGSDINEHQAGRVQRQFDIPRTTADWREVLTPDPPDAVVVSLPTSLHQEVAGAALKAGCHVFCEKPLGMSSHGARSLMELAERSARVLMVGYHNRFLDAFQEAKRVIRSGVLGNLVNIRATHLVGGPYLSWEPKSPWYFSRDNGGVLYDAGSHIFDLVHYLTGTGVEEVSTTTAKLNAECEIADQIAVAWRAEGGLIGTALLGWGGKSSKQEVFVYGTQGFVMATPMTTEVRTPQHNKISDMFSHLDAARDIVAGIAKKKLRKESVPPAYQRQIGGFLDAIQGKRSEHLSTRDSIATLEDLERVHATLLPERKPA